MVLKIALVLATLCAVLYAEDLQVGTLLNNELAFTETVKSSSIPFTTRTKNIFYSDARGRSIKGVSVVDLDKSPAQASITAGGVGSSFVNIRLKSEKGDGLNYFVQVFV